MVYTILENNKAYSIRKEFEMKKLLVVMFQSQFRNAEIVVDGSLCASFNESLHEKTLDVIEGLQGKVVNR